MRVEIEVTQADIDTGKPHDGEADPIALAVCRALGLDPDAGLVYVGIEHIQVDADAPGGFRAGEYVLPREASEFVDACMHGLDVRPFRFALDDEEGA
jgi:hypothetical protein